MEDGIAIAVALDRAKGDVPLGLRVFERIRFNRSHSVHISSVQNRDGYHNVDWDGPEIQENPEIVNLPRFEWVIEHDAEANAEANFEKLAGDVKSGKKGTIQELSLPAGGDFDVTNRANKKGETTKAKAKL